LTAMTLLPLYSLGWTADDEVAAEGSDVPGGGGSNNPWVTLSYACSQVGAGTHTIHLADGTYTDNGTCPLAVG
jgi:hypothetical protein